MAQICLTVGIPPNYEIRNKNEGRKLEIFCWDESKSDQLRQYTLGCIKALRSYGYNSYWVESCEVLDADESPLPDTLYVAVLCGREYEGRRGGSSWSASRAFVSRDKAKEYADQHESHLRWYWVVGVSKCG